MFCRPVDEIGVHRRQFLHPGLDPRQLLLGLRDRLHRFFLFFFLGGDFGRRRPQLLNARAVVATLLGERGKTVVDRVEDRPIVITEGARADRAGSALTFVDEQLTLLLVFSDRRLELLNLGLDLLLVADPLRLRRLQGALDLLELRATALELRGGLFVEAGRSLELRASCAELGKLAGQLVLASTQRHATPLVASQAIHRVELDAQTREWLDRRAKRQQLGLRGRKVRQLAILTLQFTLSRRLFALRDPVIHLDFLDALPFGLYRFPLRRERVDHRRRRDTARLHGLRMGFGDPELLGRFRRRPSNDVGVGHSGCHPGRFCADCPATLANEILRDAEALVAEETGEKLPALGCPHRRHHAQFLLTSEVGVEELLEAHSQASTEHLAHPADRVGDGDGGAVEKQLGARQPAHDLIAMST